MSDDPAPGALRSQPQQEEEDRATRVEPLKVGDGGQDLPRRSQPAAVIAAERPELCGCLSPQPPRGERWRCVKPDRHEGPCSSSADGSGSYVEWTRPPSYLYESSSSDREEPAQAYTSERIDAEKPNDFLAAAENVKDSARTCGSTVMEWQPINNVPSEIEIALVSYDCVIGPRVTVAWPSDLKGIWRCDIGTIEPTHWMPLPDPPEHSEEPPATNAVDPAEGIVAPRQRAADSSSDPDLGAALGRLPLERDAIRALCAEAGMTPESTTLDYIRSAFYRLGKVQRELRERR